MAGGSRACHIIASCLRRLQLDNHELGLLYRRSDPAFGGLVFDIGSDVFGGAVAGICCWWFCRHVGEDGILPNIIIIRKVRAGMTLLIMACVVIVGGYYLLFRQVPEYVALVAREFQKRQKLHLEHRILLMGHTGRFP
jgi:hypothetical protein